MIDELYRWLYAVSLNPGTTVLCILLLLAAMGIANRLARPTRVKPNVHWSAWTSDKKACRCTGCLRLAVCHGLCARHRDEKRAWGYNC